MASSFSLGVGNYNPFKKAAVRAPVNPYDKSTLISIYPKDFSENKRTLQPAEYFVPAGSVKDPTLVVIGPASWWREVNPDEPLLEIPVSSPVLADSIVKDAINGMLGCNMADSRPGLFWLPNEVTAIELKTKFKENLEQAIKFQNNYFKALVNLADSLWARTNGNPLAIHNDAKLAAVELGLTPEWLTASAQYAPQLIRCVACGTMRNPEFPICPNCKAVIDVDKAKKLNLKFAE